MTKSAVVTQDEKVWTEGVNERDRKKEIKERRRRRKENKYEQAKTRREIYQATTTSSRLTQ
jgi:hypothetical protein